MTLGAYLKHQRESKELKVKDVADRLEVSSSYISQLEKGVCFPSKKQLASLSKAYSIPKDDLLKRWAEVKIYQVGIETDYKFDIKEAGEKKVHEITKRLEDSLDEYKKTVKGKGDRRFEDEFIQVPVLGKIINGDINKAYPLAQELIAMPRRTVIKGHRIFSIRADGISMEDASIIRDDIVIFDRDAKISAGDIILIHTPDGLAMTYYHKRGNSLEIRPDKKGFKKMYKLKDASILGRLIYHVKKY